MCFFKNQSIRECDKKINSKIFYIIKANTDVKNKRSLQKYSYPMAIIKILFVFNTNVM